VLIRFEDTCWLDKAIIRPLLHSITEESWVNDLAQHSLDYKTLFVMKWIVVKICLDKTILHVELF